jgi:outer membrane protein OmpA-like peptidoglycan-associated protein
MALFPDNSSPDRSIADKSQPKADGEDESLQKLVNMLLDLSQSDSTAKNGDNSSSSSEKSSDRPPDLPVKPNDSVKTPKESDRNLNSFVPSKPLETRKSNHGIGVSATKSPEIDDRDGKYVWFWLKRLEEKISDLKVQIEEDKGSTFENPAYLLQQLTPLIDEAIRQRSAADKAKMGAAIGQILPTAIAHEIQHSPATIAKAIAPELALAIQEQIELDPTALSAALGSQMGDAIKNQVVLERDAMVDALYPVIGNTISKYMMEVVKSINEKVESTLSPSGLRRKILAKLQGVSEAELILQESLEYKIQAVLLIHKASGLVIRELQPAPDFKIEADMLAGMLTAISSFVNDCMGEPNSNSELHEIDYNASKILLEIAGYCYLAVIVKGVPSKRFIDKIRETLGQIVLKSGKAIASYNGDADTIPKTVDLCLDSLIQLESPANQKQKFPTAMVAILGAIIIPLGFIGYRSYIADRIEAKTAAALDRVPELSIYQVTPRVDRGELTLNGRLPNEYLRQQAETVARQTAPDWTIKNQIVAVEVPADPIRTAGEVERVTWIYNQKPGVAIAAKHDFNSKAIAVTGVVTEVRDVEQLTQALKKIPGITTITSTVQIRPVLETRLYFDLNSSSINSGENVSKLRLVRQFLDRNLGVHLKIIAHTDNTGEAKRNQQLSLQRAQSVRQALMAEGVNPSRLQIQAASLTLPPGITPEQPLWLSRSVRFEVFIPSSKSN